MKTISALFEATLAKVIALLMALIVIDVSWQVLTRFIMGDPSSYTEELARFLLMWIGFLGAAYAYRRHSHLSLDILRHKLPAHRRIWANRLIHLVSLSFALVAMVYGGLQLVSLTLSLKQTSAALQIPIGYVYLCIPVSGLLISWFALENLTGPAQQTTLEG